MRSVLSVRSAPAPENPKEWRSRDAAARAFTALRDPHQRPRWVQLLRLSKHRRGGNPSFIVLAFDGAKYKIKVLRSDWDARQFRKDHPSSDAIEFSVAEGEPMSQIRTRIYGKLNALRQKR